MIHDRPSPVRSAEESDRTETDWIERSAYRAERIHQDSTRTLERWRVDGSEGSNGEQGEAQA
ncbi:hypothetical protein [Haloplanus pelagicus]|uniref:hypothetical protein n=1 Tax=Haloplanus pelagicus TaxID=2949995 RepID=UPI00203BF9C5|nr:hypothetical protein [Haloplanus sp. HW8-1]